MPDEDMAPDAKPVAPLIPREPVEIDLFSKTGVRHKGPDFRVKKQPIGAPDPKGSSAPVSVEESKLQHPTAPGSEQKSETPVPAAKEQLPPPPVPPQPVSSKAT